MNIRNIIKRFIAYQIDSLIVNIVSLIIYLKYFGDFFPMNQFKYAMIYLFIFVIHNIVCEYFFYRTIGKKILSLKIISDNENRLKNILIRNFLKLIPFDVISILITKDHKFWHDIYSHTSVVEYKK